MALLLVLEVVWDGEGGARVFGECEREVTWCQALVVGEGVDRPAVLDVVLVPQEEGGSLVEIAVPESVNVEGAGVLVWCGGRGWVGFGMVRLCGCGG